MIKSFFNAIIRYIRQTDRILLLITLLASLFGFLLVFSAASGNTRLIVMQIAGISVGIIGMIIISKIDYQDIANLWKIIAVLSVLMLVITLVVGKGRSGSEDRSWLRFAGMSMQPAEFIKFAFVLTFAKHYDTVKESINSPVTVLLLTVHGMVPIGIIVLQKDMGMAFVFVVIFASMMFAANVQLRYFAGAGIAILISAPILWNKVFGNTQRNRILALFNPEKYPTQMFQQLQGRSAIGSGEWFGYGLFHGPKTQASTSTGLLPEKQNDMIFAVAGEELGFIGCMAIIILLTVLLVRILLNARYSKDSLGSMICIGIFASFAIQIIINLGMALMLMPVIGIALPFFSYGGSSISSSYLAIGFVLSVYMHRRKTLFSAQEDGLI